MDIDDSVGKSSGNPSSALRSRERKLTPPRRSEFRDYPSYHHRHYPSQNDYYYDDDTPSWPLYLGIALWILMGIIVVLVWYDEKYGLWDEVPIEEEEEAVIQVNAEM